MDVVEFVIAPDELGTETDTVTWRAFDASHEDGAVDAGLPAYRSTVLDTRARSRSRGRPTRRCGCPLASQSS